MDDAIMMRAVDIKSAMLGVSSMGSRDCGKLRTPGRYGNTTSHDCFSAHISVLCGRCYARAAASCAPQSVPRSLRLSVLPLHCYQSFWRYKSLPIRTSPLSFFACFFLAFFRDQNGHSW